MKSEITIADINVKKYASPPSWDIIYEFIQHLGMSNHRFEKFFGIPYNLISQIKLGTKRLPPQYWHYVYERIVPEIGPGYIKFCNQNNLTKSLPKMITKTITAYSAVAPQSVSVVCEGENGNHDRIVTVK